MLKIAGGRLFVVCLGLLFAGAAAPVHAIPPNNDKYANATVLAGTSGTASGDLTDSTFDPGEVNYRRNTGSVWYTFQAPRPGYLRVSYDPFSSGNYVDLSPFLRLSAKPLKLGLYSPLVNPDPNDPTKLVALLPAPYQRMQALQFSAETLPATFSLDYQFFGGGAFELADLPSAGRVREGQGSITVAVARRGACCELATVDYAIADGTANDGSDYSTAYSLNGTLTFQPGVTRQYLTISIGDDAAVEGPETFSVKLSSPSTNSTIIEESATITIDDNEGNAANDDFSAREILAGASGTVVLPAQVASREPGEPESLTSTLWYTWTAPVAGTLSLASTNANGPAFSVHLFTGTSLADLSPIRPANAETPAFTSGASLSFLVTAGMTYQIAVSGFTPAAAPNALAYDFKEVSSSFFRFAIPRQRVLEKTGSVTVKVERLGSTSGAVSVDFATPLGALDSSIPDQLDDVTPKATPLFVVGATLPPTIDFGAVSDTLNFGPGETVKEIAIVLGVDKEKESPEHFRIVLRNPSAGSVIDYPSSMGVEIQESAAIVGAKFVATSFSGALESLTGTLNYGTITVTLGATGRVTGALNLNGKKYPFRGTFPGLYESFPQQTSSLTVLVGPNATPITLNLHYTAPSSNYPSLAATSLTGTLTSAAGTATFGAQPPLIASPVEELDTAGAYTVALTPDINVPAEIRVPGFLTFTVGAKPTAKVTGRLPDGTAIVTTGVFARAKTGGFEVRLLQPLYAGKGYLRGALKIGFPGDSSVIPLGGDGDGRLTWVHPVLTRGSVLTAFSGNLNAYVSLYFPSSTGLVLPIAPPGSFQINLTGGGVPDTSVLGTLKSKNAVSFVRGTPGAPSFAFTAANGCFTGKIRPAGSSKPVTFRGIILSNQGRGIGFFLNGSQAGTVTLTAP